MKGIGTTIFKMESGHTTTQMEISIKGNGPTESPMVKETTFMPIIKECIKATGEMGRSKDLASSSSKINMGTPATGKKIRKMAKVHISTPTTKDTKAAGSKIRKMAKVFISIRIETLMMGTGRTIEGKEKEQ